MLTKKTIFIGRV